MCRKKNVSSSVRMCEPSTSASVMITITLWYRTFADVEVLADPGAQRGDQRPDLGEAEHLVQARLLDVQDLAAQGQDRLGAPVAPLLGRAAGAIALDDEELGERGVLLLAVGELAGQRARVERALAPHELAGLARRLARPRRLDDLLDDLARDARVLLEVRAELFVDDLLDPGLDLGGDELVLGLRGELRVLDLDRDDRGQSLPAVVAGERRLLQGLGQVARSRRTSGAPASGRVLNPSRCVPPSRLLIVFVKVKSVSVYPSFHCRATSTRSLSASRLGSPVPPRTSWK